MATRILRSTATLVSSLLLDLLPFRDIVRYSGVGGFLKFTGREREGVSLAVRGFVVSKKGLGAEADQKFKTSDVTSECCSILTHQSLPTRSLMC